MPTEHGATDINGAAARLSGLLQPEPLPTEEQEPEAQQDEPEQEQEAEQPETLEAEQETSEHDDTEAEPEKYKVKVDGEELEVTLEELQKGYMMESNYRNKTTALNKEREAIEQKAQEIDKQLEDAKALIDADLKSLESPEMKRLREDDPDEYLREYERIQGKVKSFENLHEQRAKEQQARQEKLIEKEREALFDAFPEWKGDQAKMQQDTKEIFDSAKKLGFTDDELANVSDHRFFVLAHKARLLDEMQNQSLDEKKVKPKPKNVKPGTGTTKEDRMSQQVRAQRERLKKSGNIRDAVKLLQM